MACISKPFVCVQEVFPLKPLSVYSLDSLATASRLRSPFLSVKPHERDGTAYHDLHCKVHALYRSTEIRAEYFHCTAISFIASTIKLVCLLFTTVSTVYHAYTRHFPCRMRCKTPGEYRKQTFESKGGVGRTDSLLAASSTWTIGSRDPAGIRMKALLGYRS